MNAVDYLRWRGDLEFNRDFLNEIDALIFSWLSYYEFEKLRQFGLPFINRSLKQIADIHKSCIDAERAKWVEIDAEVDFDKTIIARETAPHLLYIASQTNRFDDVRVVDFKEVFSEERVVQFAVVTFELNNGERIVSFRGTDSTIVGWKEDCMLSYLDEIPGQTEAVRYMNAIDASKKHYIVGHSKGGNEALYAYLKMDEAKAESVLAVYNFDGPGLPNYLYRSPRYLENRGKFHKFVPSSSIVGVLLEKCADYVVVKSKSSGFFQHNALFWQVIGARFETEKENSFVSKTADKTFAHFLSSDTLTPQNKAYLVDTIFDTLQNAGVKKFSDIMEDKKYYISKIVKSLLALNTSQKKIMYDAALQLWKAVKEAYGSVNTSTQIVKIEKT